MSRRRRRHRWHLYWDWQSWSLGYYRDDETHYVHPFLCVVMWRKRKEAALRDAPLTREQWEAAMHNASIVAATRPHNVPLDVWRQAALDAWQPEPTNGE